MSRLRSLWIGVRRRKLLLTASSSRQASTRGREGWALDELPLCSNTERTARAPWRDSVRLGLYHAVSSRRCEQRSLAGAPREWGPGESVRVGMAVVCPILQYRGSPKRTTPPCTGSQGDGRSNISDRGGDRSVDWVPLGTLLSNRSILRGARTECTHTVGAGPVVKVLPYKRWPRTSSTGSGRWCWSPRGKGGAIGACGNLGPLQGEGDSTHHGSAVVAVE